MNRVISSAIAVSAITASTVFNLNISDINSYKADAMPQTGQRFVLRSEKFIQTKGKLVRTCKNALKTILVCKSDKSQSLRAEANVTGSVDLKVFSAETGLTVGLVTVSSDPFEVQVEPQKAVKIYAAVSGMEKFYEYQVLMNNKWVKRGTVRIPQYTAVTHTAMPCTHSAAQGGCGF
jgi:hypothetical protein